MWTSIEVSLYISRDFKYALKKITKTEWRCVCGKRGVDNEEEPGEKGCGKHEM